MGRGLDATAGARALRQDGWHSRVRADRTSRGSAGPAFDMAVWAIRRDSTQVAAVAFDFLGGPGALDEVLRRADYLVITLPLTPASRGLLGPRELSRMKSSAVLVNVARAEIVDEEALHRALAQGTIAGAALDVWYRYPAGPGATHPARYPFHELPNVLMTPHVSGWTKGMLEARASLIAENIRRVAEGEPPLNLIGSVPR
jgi:phosphoglycerate dehydrogenase-like enzyme